MNRSELIDAMVKHTGATKADTDRFLNAFTTTIEKNIRKKEGVKLVGFGTFAISKRKARLGRNPQTGEEIQIPARTVPVFRPGALLKQAVNTSK